MKENTNFENFAQSEFENLNSNDAMEIAYNILLDARSEISDKPVMSIPISEFSTLGASASALVAAFNTINKIPIKDSEKLYRLVNSKAGDNLKVARDGNFWGAMKTADKKSKMAKFQKVNSVSSTSVPIDPVSVMIAVSLYSIEKSLDNIAEMQKQILSFLEIEKESEIEADLETLLSIISKYKFNYGNDHYIKSNHKMRGNM